MLFSDLFETASLPLLPKQLGRVRGSYAAFIITMAPGDFIRLTTTDADEFKSIVSKPFPYDRDKYAERMGREEGYGRYDMPFLKVHFPSGKIFGHEGRHRSAMVMAAGGHTIPVTIYPYADDEFTCQLVYYDEDGERVERKFGRFINYKDAEAALADAMVDVESNVDNMLLQGRCRVTTLLGSTLKGAPERSEGWERAAWKIEDFPQRLIGQYDETFSLSNFKVGLVKGYRHFSR